MKLHYSSEQTANNRYRKVKAVAAALGLNLEEVAHDSSADLTTISPFNTLPLLQTAEGTFFSSNTIVRYLANSQGKLYGGQNILTNSLVDQWLDITVCDLEAAVAAITIATHGTVTVDTTKVSEDVHKFLAALEGQLHGKKFLVGE
jgi:glutathione S-transferase